MSISEQVRDILSGLHLGLKHDLLLVGCAVWMWDATVFVPMTPREALRLLSSSAPIRPMVNRVRLLAAEVDDFVLTKGAGHAPMALSILLGELSQQVHLLCDATGLGGHDSRHCCLLRHIEEVEQCERTTGPEAAVLCAMKHFPARAVHEGALAVADSVDRAVRALLALIADERREAIVVVSDSEGEADEVEECLPPPKRQRQEC